MSGRLVAALRYRRGDLALMFKQPTRGLKAVCVQIVRTTDLTDDRPNLPCNGVEQATTLIHRCPKQLPIPRKHPNWTQNFRYTAS